MIFKKLKTKNNYLTAPIFFNLQIHPLSTQRKGWSHFECLFCLQYLLYIIGLHVENSLLLCRRGAWGWRSTSLPAAGQSGPQTQHSGKQNFKKSSRSCFQRHTVHSVQGRPLKKQRTVRINMTTRCDFFGFIPGSNSPFSLENIKKERSKNEAKKFITAWTANHRNC